MAGSFERRLRRLEALLGDHERRNPRHRLHVTPQDSGGYWCWELERTVTRAELERLAEQRGAELVICHGEGDPRLWRDVIELTVAD